MKKYKVIGLMSGTSLDGLDIAYCEFKKKDKAWSYQIKQASTIAYKQGRQDSLRKLMSASAEELSHAHSEFGVFMGKETQKFITKHGLKPDFICSHGHTIFHQPSRGFTLQIGNGANIYAQTGIPVVCDFRSIDVALGGQGAPLVPIGDKLLFPKYEFCLNLGGISNISFDHKGKRIAYDISFVNIVLNELAGQKGLPYDKNGKLALSGKVDQELLNKLNSLDYYKKTFPKSLGKEWIDQNVFPLLGTFDISIEDKLATTCNHIAFQIAKTVKDYSAKKKSNLLITGGGAFNSYLVQKIEENLKGYTKVIVPDKYTVMFKEALIFAFLGVLRIRNEANCLKSVTGSKFDNIGGALYGPIPVSF